MPIVAHRPCHRERPVAPPPHPRSSCPSTRSSPSQRRRAGGTASGARPIPRALTPAFVPPQARAARAACASQCAGARGGPGGGRTRVQAWRGRTRRARAGSASSRSSPHSPDPRFTHTLHSRTPALALRIPSAPSILRTPPPQTETPICPTPLPAAPLSQLCAPSEVGPCARRAPVSAHPSRPPTSSFTRLSAADAGEAAREGGSERARKRAREEKIVGEGERQKHSEGERGSERRGGGRVWGGLAGTTSILAG
jgi:hypothetical protein